MRKAIRNVSPARAIRTLVSMILGSILSVSTPPAREKKMIAAAGRPFTIPTQSLESVISSTSHPMTIVNIWAPINVQPIAQAKVAKVPDTQSLEYGGLPHCNGRHPCPRDAVLYYLSQSHCLGTSFRFARADRPLPTTASKASTCTLDGQEGMSHRTEYVTLR